jgi:hypothetical protein
VKPKEPTRDDVRIL